MNRKSDLAIEYSYQASEQIPDVWVFWVNAINAAKFEEGYRMIANSIKLPGREDPTTNILQLVSSWLLEEENGPWILILDNADDLTMFSDPRKIKARSDIGDVVGKAESLSTFLPITPSGSILMTSRSIDVALRFTGSHDDIIKVEPLRHIYLRTGALTDLETHIQQYQEDVDITPYQSMIKEMDGLCLPVRSCFLCLTQSINLFLNVTPKKIPSTRASPRV